MNDMESPALAAARRLSSWRAIEESTHPLSEEAETPVRKDAAAEHVSSYLRREGYSERTIDAFALGVSDERTRYGRLTIPVHDQEGQIVGLISQAVIDAVRCAACGEKVTANEMWRRSRQYKSSGQVGDWRSCPHCRAPNNKARVGWVASNAPRFLNAPGGTSFPLYGWYHSAFQIQQDDSDRAVVIVEGYSDAHSVYQAGYPTLAYSGAKMSERQMELVAAFALQHQRPVLLLPDGDQTAARTRAEHLQRMHELLPTLPVGEVQYPEHMKKLDPYKKHLDPHFVHKEYGLEALAEMIKQAQAQLTVAAH